MTALLSIRIGVPIALLAGLCATAQAQQLTANRTPDPARAIFVYDDVDHFIAALDRIEAGADTVAILEAEYFGRATPGLAMFVEKYDLTPERLTEAIRQHPEKYADLDRIRRALTEQEPQFRRLYAQLKKFAPLAEFPPTYFLVGAYRGIGSGSIEGPLITVEKETPEGIESGGLATTLVHEMVHLEQLMLQGDDYFAIFGPEKTLLALTIREGTADYIAQRVTGTVSSHDREAHDYVLDREAELWRRFRMEMLEEETGDWLWETPADPEQPQDVGYALGARIVGVYYDAAPDKAAAVREILAVTDYEVFLERSGYAERFSSE